MCNCFETVTKEYQQRVKVITEKKLDVYSWEENTGMFKNKSDLLSSDSQTVVTLPFTFTFTRRKNSGDPEIRTTTAEIQVLPKFCPFCGEAIK